MTRDIVIIGDSELGCGDLHDDFVSDNLLAGLIRKFARKKGAVDFVCNGDTFDFLKAPYVVEGRHTFPTAITAKISLQKLRRMKKAHAPVFDAFAEFTKNRRHRLFFLYGNHDPDLNFPQVQRLLKKWIGGAVLFARTYHTSAVHAEHGSEYDLVNNAKHFAQIVKRKGKDVLNLPLVSIGVIRMQSEKILHPFIERINPFKEIVKRHPTLKKTLRKGAIRAFFTTIVKNPLQVANKVTQSMLKDIVQRITSSSYTVHSILDTYCDAMLEEKFDAKIYVIGHSHETKIVKRNGKVFIHPDTWRDEYIFDDGVLRVKSKHYVHVKEHRSGVSWDLITVSDKRKPILFTDVLQDEHGVDKRVRKNR